MIIGLVIAGVGLVLSLGTYAAASSGSGGGGYFILWGAVVFGLIRAARGFSMMSKAGSHAPGTSAQPAQPRNVAADPGGTLVDERDASTAAISATLSAAGVVDVGLSAPARPTPVG